MTDWQSIASSVWNGATPELLLLGFLLFMASGFPVAFGLGGASLLCLAFGLGNDVITLQQLQTLPAEILNHTLLNRAYLSLPLVILLAELMIETGQMARASTAIKGLFDADVFRPKNAKNGARRAARQQKLDKRHKSNQRSIILAIALPASVLLIFIADRFALPAEYLAAALAIPALGLFLLYFINWLADLWAGAFAAKTRSLLDPTARTPDARPWIRLSFAVLIPLLLVAAFPALLLHWHLSIFASLSLLILALVVLSLFQGKLTPVQFGAVLGRASLACASLAAMLITAYCFHWLFMRFGGEQHMQAMVRILIPQGEGGQPWLTLFGLLFAMMLIGLILDWLVMSLVVLPMVLPIFAHMDFSDKLAPFWPQSTSAAFVQGEKYPLSIFDLPFHARLWFASLVWLTLFTALVTFSRQNGELAEKELVSWTGSIKDSPASLALFLTLQIVGLIAVIIMPQAVLWLPALMLN
ncbi:hypothetical protein [uncultured Cohaesibacter sp.]|uniref:hypothetical protein n=1 Tax=uncultured Cohaesibacter sp. TaxID=1002546 RepID=UPI00292DE921|nr:hypothetical protein [uncultured Cohaesibacter sp.]